MIGTVVTVKTVGNDELMGKMVSVDEDHTVLTLELPMCVQIKADRSSVGLIPFSLTSDDTLVNFNVHTIVSVMRSMEASVTDYNRVCDQVRKANRLREQLRD